VPASHAAAPRRDDPQVVRRPALEETGNFLAPVVATPLNNLALLLQDLNRPDEAEPLMRRAVAIGEKSLGPDHPQTQKYRRTLSRLLGES